MTPQDMAALHGAAFTDQRGWSDTEITTLLDSPFTAALTRPAGFALIRTLAGESELLTLAVDPRARRQGIARSIMQEWLERITPLAQTAFLEVAADNHAARALYAGFGFTHSATRTGYYARKDAQAVDALVLHRDLTHG